MNILIVNNNLYQSGGDWSYVNAVTQLFRSHGHKVHLWGIKRSGNIEKDDEDLFVTPIDLHTAKKSIISSGVKVLLNSIYSREARVKMDLFLERHNIDIVQLNTIRLGVTPSIVEPIKKRKIPIVWRMIDYYQICPNFKLRHHGHNCEECLGGHYSHCIKNNCKNSFLSSMLVTIEAYFYKYRKEFKQIDMYSFQNNFTRGLFLRAGYEQQQTIVQYNPFDTSKIEPSFELGSTVLYFGRLVEEKGVDVILNVAAVLPDHRFIIVGNGAEEEKLNALKNSMSLNNVEFIGPLWGEKLDKVIKESLCVVVPSVWQECSSYVAFQAFANARPVIASNIGGLPEVVKDGYNGYLFTPGNSQDLKQKILELSKNKENAMDMGKNGLDFVRDTHSPEHYYQTSIELFNRLVKNK